MPALPVIAHRGASAEAPENTLAAFHLAWHQEADGIEGDFHLTADGQIVCMHDADLRRMAGVALRIAEESLATLRRAASAMPTFAEIAQILPAGKRFYVEVKDGPAMVPKLLQEAAAAEILEQVVVIAFDPAVIAAVTELAPEVRRYWLMELPEVKPEIGDLAARLAAIGAHGVSTNVQPCLDAALIGALREHGYSWHVWTVDEPAVALRLAKAGIASITTNRPGRIRQALRAGTAPGEIERPDAAAH